MDAEFQTTGNMLHENHQAYATVNISGLDIVPVVTLISRLASAHLDKFNPLELGSTGSHPHTPQRGRERHARGSTPTHAANAYRHSEACNAS